MFLGNKKKISARQQSKIEQLEKEIEKLKAAQVKTKKDLPGDSYFVQKVIELSGLGYWIKPLHESFILLSDKALEILNVKDSPSLALQDFLACFHPDDITALEKGMNSLLRNNQTFSVECRIQPGKDSRETRYCLCKITRIERTGPDNIYYLGILIDNAGLEKARKELAKANDRIEEVERLKNTLLTNISHEIRTPMNSIIGFSELLNIGKLDFEKRREYAQTIRNQGNMLLKFIDDITELIKFEAGRIKITKTKCNLNVLLKEILVIANQQKKAWNKEILEIRLELPDKKGLIVYTDPGRLQQVISNLIHNSIKFTEKGFIEFGHRMPADEKIEFYVKDTGIGLSKEQQKNVFNRFAAEETAAGKYEGSGLGLALSKHLVKLLGGKIWVESEPGKGATFQFSIPYEQTPYDYHDYSSVVNEHFPEYKWKDKVILVVEDDEVNFRFLEAILQDSDAQILHAANGYQAVQLCQSINKIDLVLMDIKMPEMDGFEATRQIRQFNKKIPIIAQTAYILEIDKEKCFSVGCNDCITKPIDIKDFLDIVNGFLKE